MSNSVEIFNIDLLKVHQKRARKIGFIEFLDKVSVDQVAERLSEINRNFKNPAIIGGKANFWAKHLDLPNAKLIADGHKLKFDEGRRHDLIIHALSLHWYNDPVGQLIQVRNALEPDGLMLAFLLGGDTLKELRGAFQTAEINNENGLSPRVAPMIDLRDAGDLLVRAGFALTVADKTNLSVSYKSPLHLLYDLRGMGETSIMVHGRKNFLRRATFNEFLRIYSKDYTDDHDKSMIKATFQILCLTGWSPSNDQQKPLPPGSAKHHFSEVLKNYEL